MCQVELGCWVVEGGLGFNPVEGRLRPQSQNWLAKTEAAHGRRDVYHEHRSVGYYFSLFPPIVCLRFLLARLLASLNVCVLDGPRPTTRLG